MKLLEKIVPRLLGFLSRVMWEILKASVLIIGRELLVHKQTEARTEDLAQREAQRRMNEFVSIASHELKTPLTSIKGNIQLMVRRLKNSLGGDSTLPDETIRTLTEARELLERTDQQITRLSRLVNTLLEGSRINADTMDLLLELCELDTLVKEVVQDTRHIPATRTIRIEMPTKKTVFVMADVNRIKQVVVHYLSNAHKFSTLDRPIQVCLQAEGQMARISVHDGGPGIPLSEQRRVWDRFYRVQGIEVQNGSEVGLGLGLHISRIIVKQHHGQVGVQSAPGAGSTFWFTLPIMNKETTPL